MDILDTDFAPEQRVKVWMDGREVYAGEVGNMPDDIKRVTNRMNWYLLNESFEDGCEVLFVG